MGIVQRCPLYGGEYGVLGNTSWKGHEIPTIWSRQCQNCSGQVSSTGGRASVEVSGSSRYHPPYARSIDIKVPAATGQYSRSPRRNTDDASVSSNLSNCAAR